MAGALYALLPGAPQPCLPPPPPTVRGLLLATGLLLSLPLSRRCPGFCIKDPFMKPPLCGQRLVYHFHGNNLGTLP